MPDTSWSFLRVAIALILLPRAAQSQVMIGSVFDSTGAPIPDAEVFVLGAGAQARSSATGRFALPLRRGVTQLIRVRKLGFVPRTVQLEPMASGDSAFHAIELSRLPVELPTVVVEAREVSYVERLSGFAERMATSSAPRSAFWTREDIARRNPSRVSDLALRNDQRCQGRPSIFLNGALLDAASTTDVVNPLELEAMEIYRGASQIPARFNVTSSPGRRPGCVILLWTR